MNGPKSSRLQGVDSGLQTQAGRVQGPGSLLLNEQRCLFLRTFTAACGMCRTRRWCQAAENLCPVPGGTGVFRVSLSALRAPMHLLCQHLWSFARKQVKRVIRPRTLARRAAMVMLALGQSADVKVSILCWPMQCKRRSSQGRGCAGQSP